MCDNGDKNIDSGRILKSLFFQHNFIIISAATLSFVRIVIMMIKIMFDCQVCRLLRFNKTHSTLHNGSSRPYTQHYYFVRRYDDVCVIVRFTFLVVVIRGTQLFDISYTHKTTCVGRRYTYTHKRDASPPLLGN